MVSQDTDLIDAIFKLSRFMRESIICNNDLTHLSMLQLQTLVFLKKHEDSQMSEVANEFNIELPSATSLINKLVKAAFVIRKADIKDRRLVRVSLTQKGKRLLTEAMDEKTKRISQNLKALTAKEKKDLLRITQKMVMHMEGEYEKK